MQPLEIYSSDDDDEEEEEEQEENPSQRTYEQLLVERYDYEEHLYNTLIGHSNGIYFFTSFITEVPEQSSSFWDPVVVCLNDSQIEQLETIEEQKECFICKENASLFKKVVCCNNHICTDCTTNWFKKSVFCPFCKHDQREAVSQRENII